MTTKTQRALTTAKVIQGYLGRWIIVKASNEDLAWSGRRWVMHHQGVPVMGIQVCNFETRAEAWEYVKTTLREDGKSAQAY